MVCCATRVLSKPRASASRTRRRLRSQEASYGSSGSCSAARLPWTRAQMPKRMGGGGVIEGSSELLGGAMMTRSGLPGYGDGRDAIPPGPGLGIQAGNGDDGRRRSTDGDTVVFDCDGDLLPDHEARFRQLVHHCIFVIRFRKSGAERIGDGESASNDTFGNFVAMFSIGVHRRSSAVVILFASGPYRFGRIGRKLTADERR